MTYKNVDAYGMWVTHYLSIPMLISGERLLLLGAEVFESLKYDVGGRMDKLKWPEKTTNEDVLQHIGEKRMISYV